MGILSSSVFLGLRWVVMMMMAHYQKITRGVDSSINAVYLFPWLRFLNYADCEFCRTEGDSSSGWPVGEIG